MARIPPSWGSAPEILASMGARDDPSFYMSFTGENEKAALTIPLIVQSVWAANDADRFADLFTEDGSELIGDDQMRGREEIRSYMRAGFAGTFKGSRVTGWPLHVKFLSHDVALLVTGGGVLMAGESKLAPERELRSTWVIRKEGPGRLRLVSHQSSPLRG